MSGPDPRFFEALGPLSLGELAAAAGARCPPERAAQSAQLVSILDRASAASVSFLGDRKFVAAARETRAGACFVLERDAAALPSSCVALVTASPRASWAAASSRLHRPRRVDPSQPAIHPSAMIEEGAVVGHGVVIGADVQIGAGTEIGAYAVIGPGVTIGRDCSIGANAVVGFALIGDNVRLCASAAIGEPGFGVAAGPRGLVDVPQLGRVLIQDGVSIGAHTCVDRGAYEDTVVGENSKIDNFVQIAHNVVIGRNCAIAAHTGLSGSCVVGDGVQVGGHVGLADHVVVGAGARVAAMAGVMRDVPPGESWCGTPAKPVRQFFREVAWLTRAAAGRSRGGEA